MLKKIFLGLGAVVIICVAVGAYFVHANNEQVKLENIQASHISIVNKIIGSGEIDVQAINEMRQAIAKMPEFKDYDDVLQIYINIAKGVYVSEKQPVTIEVNANGPSSKGTWDASVVVTNNTDKNIDHVDFEIIGENTAGETVSCKNKTKCRWSDLKAGETAKTGVWTLYLEKDMNKDMFKANDVQIYYSDGSTWIFIPAMLKNLESLKTAFEKGLAIHKL